MRPPEDGGGTPSARFDPRDGVAPTAAQLRRIRFPRPRRGERGYDSAQVDAMVELLTDALAGRTSITSQQVSAARFGLAPAGRGYDQRAVDEVLAAVERQLGLGRVGPTRWRTGAQLRALRLPRIRRGYDSREVDVFLARAASALDGHGGMTSFEVRSTRFSMASALRRGYRIDAVDIVLDELEQELRSRGR